MANHCDVSIEINGEWKTISGKHGAYDADTSEYVSTCCGADYVNSIDYENDIETEEPYVCNSCQDYCDIMVLGTKD